VDRAHSSRPDVAVGKVGQIESQLITVVLLDDDIRCSFALRQMVLA
jgi:hypothetical protein